MISESGLFNGEDGRKQLYYKEYKKFIDFSEQKMNEMIEKKMVGVRARLQKDIIKQMNSQFLGLIQN